MHVTAKEQHMTYNYALRKVCDGCDHDDRRNLIEIRWASGSKHYCEECWPYFRNDYEDEEGRKAWKRVGNYYVPTE
jgi:hypothetical protein